MPPRASQKSAPTPERPTPSSGAGKFVLALILILLLIAAASAYTKKSVEKEQTELSNSAQLLQNKLSQLENEVSNLKEETKSQKEKLGKIAEAIYRVEDRPGNDLRIVRVEIEGGKEEAVVASVKAAAGFTGKHDGVVGYAVFPKEKQIIVRKIYTGPGADESSLLLDLWKYDIEKNSFSELTALNQFDAQNRELSYAVSPDKKRIALVVGDEKGDNTGSSTKVHVLHVLSGEVKTVLSLSDDQSLNARYSYPGVKVSIEWKSGSELAVGIFDQTKVDPKKKTEKPLIQTQSVKIE